MKVTITVEDARVVTQQSERATAPLDGPESSEPSDMSELNEVSLVVPTPGKRPKVIPLSAPLASYLRQLIG